VLLVVACVLLLLMCLCGTLLMGFCAFGCCFFCSFQVQLRSHSGTDSLALLAVAVLRLPRAVLTTFWCRLLVLQAVDFPRILGALAVVAVDS
jgi:hypothetical protein